MHAYAYLKNVHWVPAPNKLELFLETLFPPEEIQRIAGVFGFVFDDEGRLLLVKLKAGRLSLPGGGIEPGELPEQAFIREVWEEARVRVHQIRLLAWQTVTSLAVAEPPGNTRPWPVFHELYFTARVSAIEKFEPLYETSERHFLSFADAIQQEPIQYQFTRVMLEAARGQ